MSAVRTLFWDGTRWLWKRPWRRPRLRVGNAGDIFTLDLVRSTYGVPGVSRPTGPRLLLVGSIAHVAQPNDIVCGIGVKHEEFPLDHLRGARILGVRGPRTLDLLERAGLDTGELRFQFDPGMLAERFVSGSAPEPSGRIFIPHYREHPMHLGRMPSGVRLVSIDARPVDLLDEIQAADVVYTSSLHGVIFAHALGRPVVLVAPQTDEPIFKYMDHFASLGLVWKQPFADIDSALRAAAPISPVDVGLDLDAFVPPTLDELRTAGVIEA